MNQSSASAAAVKPLNILIVDDSATMRALLHRVVGLADLPSARSIRRRTDSRR